MLIISQFLLSRNTEQKREREVQLKDLAWMGRATSSLHLPPQLMEYYGIQSMMVNDEANSKYQIVVNDKDNSKYRINSPYMIHAVVVAPEQLAYVDAIGC